MVRERSDAAAIPRVDQELAWRMFTKALDARGAEQQVEISGDRSLALRVRTFLLLRAR
jgi:hypothetical protein